MTKNPDDPAGGRGLLRKAQDALAAMIGLASAKTVGSHDAATYVASAAVADLYEVEASRVALRRTGSPQIRSFAQLMIEDHGRALDLLASKARLAGLQDVAEPQMDQRRTAMLENLHAASDLAFDKVFLTQQTATHQEAVALHEGYAADGDNAVLRGLAFGAAPTLEQHLQMATHLRSQI